MRVASKVAVGTGSLLLVFAGAMVHQLTVVRGLAKAHREISTEKTQAAKIALDTIRRLKEMEESVEKLYVTRDRNYGKKIERLRREVAQGLATIGSFDLSGEEEAAFARLSEAWEALPATPSAGGRATSLVAPLRRLLGRTEDFLAAVEKAIDLDVREATAAGEDAERIAFAVVAVALLASLLVVLLTVRSIGEPLRRLTAGTHAVAEGQFDLELDTSRGDEFSQLAADFNSMVRRLGELDTLKKDLLSHVSHELKTPLATLQETQQLLLEEIPGPLREPQRRLIELNLKSSERLSRLISKLLDLSQLEAGVMAYDFSRREIGPLVADAVEELAPRGRERGIRMETEMPGEPLEIQGDGDRLIQVLANLVENAIKFSPEGSVVRLRVEALDEPPEGRLPSAPPGRGAVLVTVSDSGPGVPDSEKARIFEKFHQAGPRRGGSVGGAGLGLAICRVLTEAHGGVLWVTDNPGGGSVFSLLLPRI